MKNFSSGLVILFVSFFMLAGCADKPAPSGNSDVPPDSMTGAVDEVKSVQLIRSMMNLNYASMTVDEFNDAIQNLCTDAGTNVFAVISDAYEHFSVYSDSGEFTAVKIDYRDLERFMQTTLEYSAQEIFGEPVHMGSVMYITMPDMTAMEVFQMKEQMQPDEWNRFFEDHIEDITVYPILSYVIETDIQDTAAITVAERDDRINNTCNSIEMFLLEMDTESVMAENLWDIIDSEFADISAEYSDSNIRVKCRIQGLERDIES